MRTMPEPYPVSAGAWCRSLQDWKRAVKQAGVWEALVQTGKILLPSVLPRNSDVVVEVKLDADP